MLYPNQAAMLTPLIDALKSDKDVVLAGPSACGKSYLIDHILQTVPDISNRIVTDTSYIRCLPTHSRMLYTNKHVKNKYIVYVNTDFQLSANYAQLDPDRWVVINMTS